VVLIATIVAEANGSRAEVRMWGSVGQGSDADRPFGGMCQGPGPWDLCWQHAISRGANC
jgi:hypothetical protein